MIDQLMCRIMISGREGQPSSSIKAGCSWEKIICVFLQALRYICSTNSEKTWGDGWPGELACYILPWCDEIEWQDFYVFF